MMDKNREAFESWWKQPEQAELRASCSQGWGYYIWICSRNDIEIPVPKRRKASEFSNYEFGPKDLAATWNSCRNQILKGITSLGIRVKGNEE